MKKSTVTIVTGISQFLSLTYIVITTLQGSRNRGRGATAPQYFCFGGQWYAWTKYIAIFEYGTTGNKYGTVL